MAIYNKTFSLVQGQSFFTGVGATRQTLGANTQGSVYVVPAPLGLTLTTNVVRVKSLSLSQGQTSTRSAQVGKITTLSQGQSVSYTKQEGKIVSLSQGQNIGLLKSISKSMTSLSQGQTITLAKGTAHFSILSLTQGQSMSLVKSIGHILKPSQAQSLVLTKQEGKTVSLSQGQSLTNGGRTVNKAITSTQGQSIVLNKGTATYRTLSLSQGQSLTLNKGNTKGAFSLSQGQVIVLTKTTNKILIVAGMPPGWTGLGGITQSQGSTMQGTVYQSGSQNGQGISISFLVGQTNNRNLSLTQGQNIIVNRTKALVLNPSQAQSLILLKTDNKSFILGQNQTLIITHVGGKVLTVSAPQNLSLGKALNKLPYILSQGQNISVGKQNSYTLHLTQAQAVTINKGYFVTLIVAALYPSGGLYPGGGLYPNPGGQPQVIVMTKQRAEAFSLSQAQSLGLSKSVGKSFILSQGQNISMFKGNINKLMLLPQSQGLTYLWAVSKITGLNLTQPQALLLNVQGSGFSYLQMQQTQNATVGRATSTTITLSQSQSPKLLKQLNRIWTLSQGQSATLGDTITHVKSLNFSQAQLASYLNGISKSLFVGAIQSLTLPKSITPLPYDLYQAQIPTLGLPQGNNVNLNLTQGQLASIAYIVTHYEYEIVKSLIYPTLTYKQYLADVADQTVGLAIYEGYWTYVLIADLFEVAQLQGYRQAIIQPNDDVILTSTIYEQLLSSS